MNDVWQGPSWSTIEYSGTWKATHYTVKRAYSPHVVTALPSNCSSSLPTLGSVPRPCVAVSPTAATTVQFYTTLDGNHSGGMSKVIVELWAWAAGHTNKVAGASVGPLHSWSFSKALSKQESVLAGYESVETLLQGHSGADVFLRIREANPALPTAPDTFHFFSEIKDANLAPTSARITEVKLNASDTFSATVTVQTDSVEAFLCVDLTSTDIVGFFDDNNFMMLPGDRVLTFTSREPLSSVKELQNALVIRTVNNIAK